MHRSRVSIWPGAGIPLSATVIPAGQAGTQVVPPIRLHSRFRFEPASGERPVRSCTTDLAGCTTDLAVRARMPGPSRGRQASDHQHLSGNRALRPAAVRGATATQRACPAVPTSGIVSCRCGRPQGMPRPGGTRFGETAAPHAVGPAAERAAEAVVGACERFASADIPGGWSRPDRRLGVSASRLARIYTELGADSRTAAVAAVIDLVRRRSTRRSWRCGRDRAADASTSRSPATRRAAGFGGGYPYARRRAGTRQPDTPAACNASRSRSTATLDRTATRR